MQLYSLSAGMPTVQRWENNEKNMQDKGKLHEESLSPLPCLQQAMICDGIDSFQISKRVSPRDLLHSGRAPLTADLYSNSCKA